MNVRTLLPAGWRNRWLTYVVISICFIIIGVLFISAFERIPIEGTSLGIDWGGLYNGLQGGHVTYGNATGLRIAPWAIPFVLPLGFLSFRGSWGLLVILTLGVLVISVPRPRGKKGLWAISVVLLVSSFPSLRHAADGNFEGLIIAGLLLIMWGYRRQQLLVLALGLLLATAKIQETWVLMVILGYYIARTWPFRLQLWLGAILAVVIVPALLILGGTWLSAMGSIPERGSVVDFSLGSSLTRVGFPPVLVLSLQIIMFAFTCIIAWRAQRSLKWYKATLLVCASMLLAPYAAGNSFLTVMAIGIMPLFQLWPAVGGALIALVDLQYFLPKDFQFAYSAFFWTLMMVVTWVVCGYRVWNSEIKSSKINLSLRTTQ